MSERQARVSQSGCSVFLTVADLRALGVDPEVVDSVEYRISEDGLRFVSLAEEQ